MATEVEGQGACTSHISREDGRQDFREDVAFAGLDVQGAFGDRLEGGVGTPDGKQKRNFS